MGNDVEDFLRKLIEKQMGPQAPAGRKPAPAQPNRPQQQQRPAAPRPAPRPAPPPPRLTPVLDAQIVDDVVEVVDAEAASGRGVADHVAQHLRTDEFQQRTGQLGAGVLSEEQAVQAHVRQAVGQGPQGALARGSSVSTNSESASSHAPMMTVADVAQIGAGIVGLLRSPRDLRQAFILGEVLRRPEFED